MPLKIIRTHISTAITCIVFLLSLIQPVYSNPIAPIVNFLMDEAEDGGPGTNPLIWPVTDGYYGIPSTSLTLPGPDPTAGGGLYLIDIQASYPLVDWQNLDRLYIPAGDYRFIRIGNLPDRADNKPLIITNKDGQVRIGGMGHHYVFNISGGTNWVLTGRYDPLSQTGHTSYAGHRGGKFANSQNTYGFLLDDNFSNGGSAVRVNFASKFRIEYTEIREVTFAGMLLKNSNYPNDPMQDCIINDNYIHDTGSEGLYIGATEGQPQHHIQNWRIFNNRVLRTGTEAIQLGQLAGNTQVYNNVFGPAAIDWRAAFQPYQDNNFQIGLRQGHLHVHHNIFIGSAGSMISFFAQYNANDDTSSNVGATIEDNYFSTMRGLGMYMNDTALANMSYSFKRNTFGNWNFERDEVYNETASDHLFRIANASTPVAFIDNLWNGPAKMHTALPTGNGTAGNRSGSGNLNSEAELVEFVNSGLNQSFDYLNLEMWAAMASLGQGVHADEPVIYQHNDVVTHLGSPFLCKTDPCGANLIPADNPQTWTPLPQFPDDVRVKPGSTWESLGLQPNLSP
ncbi:MAG: right-handed parallel beta-helix repeat-containing protein [Arenicella sp.]